MRLQDQGLDTVDANVEIGAPIDARDYDLAAQILFDLGFPRIRLLTNNPAKVDALRAAGIIVCRTAAGDLKPHGAQRALPVDQERAHGASALSWRAHFLAT